VAGGRHARRDAPEVIVTSNMKDYPASDLEPFNIEPPAQIRTRFGVAGCPTEAAGVPGRGRKTEESPCPTMTAFAMRNLPRSASLLHGLSDEQWDHDSLCRGWRVRDVISHMVVGYTTPIALHDRPWWPKHGFNVPRASATESAAYGSAHTPAQILAVFDTIPNDHVHKGVARVVKPQESLIDHIVHHQDIRRPLGLPRQVPEERVLAALGAAPGIGGFVGAKKRAAGLRLVATDVAWSHGDGPEVRGSGRSDPACPHWSPSRAR
jgi:uncharacterized protein (TIGR03083 family)